MPFYLRPCERPFWAHIQRFNNLSNALSKLILNTSRFVTNCPTAILMFVNHVQLLAVAALWLVGFFHGRPTTTHAAPNLQKVTNDEGGGDDWRGQRRLRRDKFRQYIFSMLKRFKMDERRRRWEVLDTDEKALRSKGSGEKLVVGEITNWDELCADTRNERANRPHVAFWSVRRRRGEG